MISNLDCTSVYPMISNLDCTSVYPMISNLDCTSVYPMISNLDCMSVYPMISNLDCTSVYPMISNEKKVLTTNINYYHQSEEIPLISIHCTHKEQDRDISRYKSRFWF